MVYDYEVDPRDYPGTETVNEIIGVDMMVSPMVMFRDAIEAGVRPYIVLGVPEMLDEIESMKGRADRVKNMTVETGDMHRVCSDVARLSTMVEYLFTEFVDMASELSDVGPRLNSEDQDKVDL